MKKQYLFTQIIQNAIRAFPNNYNLSSPTNYYLFTLNGKPTNTDTHDTTISDRVSIFQARETKTYNLHVENIQWGVEYYTTIQERGYKQTCFTERSMVRAAWPIFQRVSFARFRNLGLRIRVNSNRSLVPDRCLSKSLGSAVSEAVRVIAAQAGIIAITIVFQ